MNRDVFSANVKPGGLVSRDEIMILVCYLLASIETGLSKEDIISTIDGNKIANYFEVANAISYLLKNKNIIYNEEEKLYIVSDSGKMIADQLDVSLPYSVREQVVTSAINLLAKHKRERENSVSINKTNNGYEVTCSIPGGDFDLMKINLYVPDLLQAKTVKKNFQNNPELIYQTLLSAFTANKDLIKESLEKLSKD